MRLAQPIDFNNEGSGILSLRFRVNDWLEKSPKLSLQVRVAALGMYLNGHGTGDRSSVIHAIFKNAQSMTIQERQMFADYFANSSFEKPSDYKAVLNLPTAPSECNLLLGTQ